MFINLQEEKKIQKTILDINNAFTDSIKKKKVRLSFDFSSSLIIIEKVMNILKNESSVLKIDSNTDKSDFVIVGDIHGDLASLISIFKIEGDPSTTKYLFLGDYIDRGLFGCEVIILLFAYKCLYPENIYLIRGNHEFVDMNNEYGFKEECETRDSLGSFFYQKVTRVYNFLPICAIINNKIFCVHGGISSLIKKREDFKKVRKVGDELTFLNNIQTDFLWNDPNDKIANFVPSDRGFGSYFGKKELRDFLTNLSFDLVIRSHQDQMEGFNWNFGQNNGILTIFSTINYCETGNEGAYAKIINDNKVLCQRFNVILDNKLNGYSD